MSKLLSILMIAFLVFGLIFSSGFVMAQNNNTGQSNNQSDNGQNNNTGQNDNNETEVNDTTVKGVVICHVPPGNLDNAHTIIVGEPAVKAHLAHGDYLGVCDDETEVEVNESLEVETNNQGVLTAKLRNQERKQIKFMPENASVIARERLRVRNLTKIELQEKVHNNIPRVVYNIEAEKPGRFLGIFKFAMKVSTEIDAETGEVITTSKPWWAFLVKEIIDVEGKIEPGIPGNETTEPGIPGNETTPGNETDGNEAG